MLALNFEDYAALKKEKKRKEKQEDKKGGRRRTDLRSKEETQVTTAQTIFNLQRHLLGKAELNLARQSSSFAKVDQVFERERQGDRLTELNANIIIGLLDVGVLADGHGTVTNVALAGELDAFLCSLDDN